MNSELNQLRKVQEGPNAISRCESSWDFQRGLSTENEKYVDFYQFWLLLRLRSIDAREDHRACVKKIDAFVFTGTTIAS